MKILGIERKFLESEFLEKFIEQPLFNLCSPNTLSKFWSAKIFVSIYDFVIGEYNNIGGGTRNFSRLFEI